MAKICVIQGPNMNLLGQREQSFYGQETLEQLHARLIQKGRTLNLEITCFQSNHEGEIVEFIHKARGIYNYIIINAAAYTHTSVAIRDAILGVKIPVIEVHISNIYARESFRHKSLLADIVQGQICGLGTLGYELALEAAAYYLKQGGTMLE
ncbi:MAG: type II 3-dehydroquinate dehydratase [Bacillota bacterium]|uniref:3-dehydroquinate dehydratase n=1 Tax=Thermanaerosceptrum fracticalcis TaxID=1712410 RepID=A0A7G6E0B7_THEFR|nr:type II 3-dehydroquinate dehydratase [Thermanaerosceptrum fracticalcis]QNB45521.1 type II 3-dehydroquinate dehydratase [Thermanaerosceptrum fracticalcis]